VHRTSVVRRWLAAHAFACVIALLPRVVVAQQTDVIRGRVIGPDAAPVADGVVKATSYAGGVSKSTKTDKAGRFALVFVNGEGDYWIDFTRIGYAPKRFEIKRIGDEEVLLANARLTQASTRLDALEVLGQRNRRLPARTANAPDVGGGDRPLGTAPVSPDQAGNLAAMAAASAGLQLIPGLDGATDMYSMLGLSGEQNNTTFEGLSSGVTALPPDILATTSLRPYPFDVSIGGFSGAQISIQTMPGTNFSRRLVTTSAIMPPLEWASPVAAAQGQKYTNARVGGNAAGPIVPDRAFYNLAYNAGRQFNGLQTLLNTNVLGLRAAGVASDSVDRLFSVLRSNGIPLDRGDPAATQARDVAQFAGNVDLTPSASGAGNAFTVGGAASYQGTHPISRGGLLLSTPSHTGDASAWGANGTITHSAYFGFGALTKTTLGFAAAALTIRPYESLPEGTVRIASAFDDGTSSVKTLAFGGNSLRSSSATHAIQATNQLSWYTLDDHHTIKLATSITADDSRDAMSTSELGSFRYNSLADFDAGLPASYTRTLTPAPRRERQIVGALSLGDAWRPSDGVQVQYGVRADANRFLATPARNEHIVNTFRLDNAAMPSRVYLSPRVGMQWFYGHAPEVAFAPGAARPPRAVIHAGVGVFQNMAPASLVGSAVASTGLPDAIQSISCVGAATPVADWSAFLSDPASIPTRCADGSSGPALGTSAPNAVLFDPRFRQMRSVRAAADWSGPILDNRFVLGVQSIVSSGRNQQGEVDVNFDPTIRFSLDGETNRPIFVEPASIVPATGAISPVGSRVAPAFQHVWMEQSNLEVTSKQVSINLKPVTSNPLLHWDATYTLLDTRQTFSGFANTGGNPLEVERGPGLFGGRHTFSLAWQDFPLFDVVYVTAVAWVASGARYTPMIAGDVNGDGLLNDRAFVADPSKADPTTAAAMRSLLASATPGVRRCLARQLNAIASRGSCAAPWTVNGGLIIQFNPQKIGLPKRATATLTLQNPLALADLALHRAGDLRGWGQNIPPDQNLLFVRGFDAGARAFKYEVNQRFGSTRPQQSSTFAMPFVSIGIAFDIGMPREPQLLTQRLDAGRRRPGTRTNASVLTTFGTSAIPNPMFFILQQSDSLKLSRAQADSIASLSRTFARFTDSVWTPVGAYLASLPAEYSTADAYERYVSARVRTVDFLLTLVPDAKAVLTPAQRRKLPKQVANFLDERVLKFLRTSTAGDASAVVLR
jgi:hypothetical protein